MHFEPETIHWGPKSIVSEAKRIVAGAEQVDFVWG
jgi:hypothetical protein